MISLKGKTWKKCEVCSIDMYTVTKVLCQRCLNAQCRERRASKKLQQQCKYCAHKKEMVVCDENA